MASQWTDKSAIMRDLSFAQGRWVPGGIETAVASGKPPALNITEETEEEYFKRWTTDGDFSACPDLSLISKMLDMVHDEVPESQHIGSGPMEIKKMNPAAKAFVPKLKKVKETQDKTEEKPREELVKKKKPLRERNVAIASILARINISQDVREEPIKLSKPEDFIKASSSVPKIEKEEVVVINRRKDSVNKVNSWLQSQDISSMFKKKTSESLQSPIQSDTSVRSPKQPGQQYVPSSWADEYYKKCMDRTHIRDMVQENVWARAEKIMKEIDVQKAEEQRLQEEADAALAAALAAEQDLQAEAHHDDDDDGKCGDTDIRDDETPPSGSPEKGVASVLLPDHRHLLGGDCIVCKVLSKKPTEKELLFEENDEVKTNNNSEVEVDKDENEALFGLVRSGFVENLADIGAVEVPSESGSNKTISVADGSSICIENITYNVSDYFECFD